MNRPFNFAAGPAALPDAVIRECKKNIEQFESSGFSILELNHRSKLFLELRDELKSNLKTLLKIPDTHDTVFLQGGARQQFAMLPLNFSTQTRPARYIITGHWGKSTLAESESGHLPYEVLWSGESTEYRSLPAEKLKLDPNISYVHCTSNETIHGIQLPADPREWAEYGQTSKPPIAVDASSDLLSRSFPIGSYDFIYACAQKLCGIPGNTIVIAKKSFIESSILDVPKIWSYKNLFASDSIYNTSPVFPIYVTLLMTRWMLSEFKTIENIETFNNNKFEKIINAVKSQPKTYRLQADENAQSKMNIVFHLNDEATTESFIKNAEESGLRNIRGHRALGGIRVSNYTAISEPAIDKLSQYIQSFRA